MPWAPVPPTTKIFGVVWEGIAVSPCVYQRQTRRLFRITVFNPCGGPGVPSTNLCRRNVQYRTRRPRCPETPLTPPPSHYTAWAQRPPAGCNPTVSAADARVIAHAVAFDTHEGPRLMAG